MKLGRIVRNGLDGPEIRCVAVVPDEELAIDLRTAHRTRLERGGASPEAAVRISQAVIPSSMSAAIASGPFLLEQAALAVEDRVDEALVSFDEVAWAPPVDPPVMLDSSAFEQHLVNAHARGKRPVPDAFYAAPVYYKMNPATLLGHDATVPWPADAGYLDYELEFGIVIGPAGADLRPDEVRPHLFGITIMNDFTARDVQAGEMTAGFGPAKGKDFATALGPWVTTMDELDVDDMFMQARVNGQQWSSGSTSSLTWSIEEIVAYASRDEVVLPGEVIGSGTIGLGCGLELYRRLSPGDVVELEIDGLGTLTNSLGHPSEPRWRPMRKERRAEVTLASEARV